jgi:hypothetical protein
VVKGFGFGLALQFRRSLALPAILAIFLIRVIRVYQR